MHAAAAAAAREVCETARHKRAARLLLSGSIDLVMNDVIKSDASESAALRRWMSGNYCTH